MIRVERILSTGSLPTMTSDRIEAKQKRTFDSDAVELDSERAPEKEQQQQQQQPQEEQLAQSAQEEMLAKPTQGAKPLNVVA